MESVSQRLVLKIVISVVLAALLSGSAVFTNSSLSRINIDANLLHDGDIIFRRGTDSVSKAVLSGDKNANYSHVGLIVKLHNKTFVLHAIPAESAGERDEVKIEPLSVFISAARAIEVGIFRLKTSTDAPKSAKQATAYAVSKIGRSFDFSFDDHDDQSLYCTELVWRAYQAAGVQIVDSRYLIHFPLLTSLIIPPSAISNANNLVKIKTTFK